MEVAADAVTLVDDRQAAHLIVEPRVLDRDPGMQGEHLDQRLVIGAELRGPELVREIEAPDDLAAGRDRHAEEAGHGRVVRREPVALRVAGDVGDPVGPILADDQPEQPAAVRQVADRGAIVVADAARDEALDGAVAVDDADGGVLRVDELAHPVDDHLQHAVDVEHAADAAHRLVEREQLARGAVGTRLRAGGDEDELEGARQRGGLLGIAGEAQ